ncbi:MAG: GGDEF domain-containing phosphodiesterase [Solibacillus sp.]
MGKTIVNYIERIKNIGNPPLQITFIMIDETFHIVDEEHLDSHQTLQQSLHILEHFILQPAEQQQFLQMIINKTDDSMKVRYKRQDQSPICVQIQSVPILLEKQYYLIILTPLDSNTSGLFTATTNDIIILETSFENKIQKICTEMESLHDVVMTFTYTKEESVPLITSRSFQDFETSMITEEERNQHLQMQGEGLKDLALHQLTKYFAQQNGYDGSYFLPIYTKEQEAIGYFLIYMNAERTIEMLDGRFQEKLTQIVQLLDKISMYEQQIEALKTTDHVVNLPSYDEFVQQLKRFKQQGKIGVVKIIKAGEFSNVVGLYGRPAGEELLRQLWQRLSKASASEDSLIARFTSSALIMFTPIDFQTLLHQQTRLSDDVKDSFFIFDQQVHITLKVGIAPFDANTTVHDVVRFAEYALAKARQIHGAHTEFYTSRYDDVLGREMMLLNHLKSAIQNKEITAYFQPKYAVYNEKIASVEALARWISPEFGFVSPVEFIALAENTGLIKDLELHILETVFTWQQQRQYDGKRIVPVAVNVSPDHFYHPHFIQNLKHLLTKYYADPKYVIIEVTENMGLFDFERANEIINKLQTLGIVTSIDDFGVGYSSLSYLQKFSFNELKIDRSFIMKIDELATQKIVKAIIDIAHTLEMDVIAEGVETKEQLEILKAIRCDGIQGYYYSKPLPIDQASKLIDVEREKSK